jgi:hypothetical protein
LTSFFILASIIALYVIHRILRWRLNFSSLFFINVILLFALIFFIYQTMVIPNTFSNVATVLFDQLSADNTHLVALTQGRAVGSPPLMMQIMGTYSLTIVNAIVGVLAIVATTLGVLFRKKEWRLEVFWIPWIIAAGVIGVSVWYGGEAINRALMFMLIPVSYFAMKFLRKKPRILVVCLIILIILYFPARYCAVNYTYAPTTELRGVSFYTYHAPSNASLFYEALVPVGPPLGPEITGQIISIARVVGFYSLPSSNDVNYLTGQAQYIISSTELRNFYEYFYGVNLIENVSSSAQYRLLYDNGDFEVYSHTPN